MSPQMTPARLRAGMEPAQPKRAQNCVGAIAAFGGRVAEAENPETVAKFGGVCGLRCGNTMLSRRLISETIDRLQKSVSGRARVIMVWAWML